MISVRFPEPRAKLSNKHIFFGWVMIAKGIGIVLVVIGHFHLPDSPEAWHDIRRIIYLFHMPLFFILSGFLYIHAKLS
ncbi:MAG TPA: hypothetical protein ENJ43_06455, partial [Gammaproteobacteria bacterium]|nr:hypothetical protein [Gammaproteobacteria bacterium]